MKFKDELITNVLSNNGNSIGNTIRSLSPTEKMVIAQGYGVSAQVPTRFLAYAVPVLRLASQFPQTTTIEFYFATHGVFRANGNHYFESGETMRVLLTAYITTFYPQLSSQVRILEDAPLKNDAREAINLLFEYAKIVVANNPQISQFITKRGGDSALMYMLEHILYMRDPILVNGRPNQILLVPEMSTNNKHVIMIGGPAEKIFYQLRQGVLELSGSHAQWKSYQFFTPLGDPPTYHTQVGEPVIGDTLPGHVRELLDYLYQLKNDWGKQKNLVRDYVTLLQDCAGVEKFLLPHEVTTDTLERGYAKLKEFLTTFI